MKLNNVNERNGLNVSVSYRGLNPRKIWRNLVETQMRKLQDLAAIVSARITLERHREVTPGFRVFVTLEVPGPDFHAEARDYTLQAALLKVIDNLRRQMQSRKNRQLDRRKNSSKLGLLHGRTRQVLNAVRSAARGFSPQRTSAA
jgi:ribosome-associated translation inhibitor RaiA